MPSEKRRAPKEAHRTPVLALGSLRPRQRDIPWPEQAAAQTTHGGLPLDVRIAMAVTHALGQELGEATEEHQEQYGAYPYRTDLFAALGDRLGIHERTLRRTHGGHRWATLPELVMFLSDASLGPRLAARLRSLEVDLLAARPSLSRNGGLPDDPGTVEDMENDGFDLLEQEVRERVRILASRQATAAANHVSSASQVNWLAVEGIYQHHVWGSLEWEKAYGARNLSETANSNLKDHHGRFSKGSIKVLGRNRIALALAFFVDAVNTRLIINMPSDFYEQWTGEPDPYLPDDEDPAWWDGDHPPQPTRAGPPESYLTTSPAQPERIAS